MNHILKKSSRQGVYWITWLVLLLFVAVTSVWAYRFREIYPNYVGSSTAKAESNVRAVVEDPNRFACDVKSYMAPATRINIIGWRWAACTNRCRYNPQHVIDSSGVNPYYKSGTSASASSYVVRRDYGIRCTDNQQIIVGEATHDFNHSTAPEPWTPYTRKNMYYSPP